MKGINAYYGGLRGPLLVLQPDHCKAGLDRVGLDEPTLKGVNMIRLTASSNPIIKQVRSLKNKSRREEKGLYFIEGSRFVEEALAQEQTHILFIIVSDSFALSKGSAELLSLAVQRVEQCYLVPDSLLRSISDTQNPQGILAVLKQEKLYLDEHSPAKGLLLILDSIKDPGNMGTIIRTADAAGCAGVVITEGCVDVYNPKVLRSTMGSIFHIPVYHGRGIEETMEVIKESGFLLYVSHLEGALSIYEADLSMNIGLIIGSEAEGASDQAVRKADCLVKIPMAGRAESLNASTAAAVIIFEAMRQRGVASKDILNT